MKSEKQVWGKFVSTENTKTSIKNAAKGKRKYRSVRRILKKLDAHAEQLSNMLDSDKFEPAPFQMKRKLTDSGKWRNIFNLKFFPDRCVEHNISLVMAERWRKSLTDDTYACIPGRGITSNEERYNLCKRVKDAIRQLRGHKIYVLQMDIHHCYESVDNKRLAERYRHFCKDERLLHVMDKLNFMSEGLLIGRYMSQLWINIYLGVLDRFVKEVLGARFYFRYMDDIVIIWVDKQVLHGWQWRIMNFLWYELGLECNKKRQVYPLGDMRTERGLDFGGYVFYNGFTLLRKRIKKNFAKRRRHERSLPSYLGIAQHCESRNLTDKILNRDNDMQLSQLVKKIERPFEGDNIKIEAIIDREIEVLDFEVRPSEKKPNTEYLKMQIRYEGRKRFVGGGYQFLCQILKQVDKKDLPFTTIIRNKRGYYFDGTIDEE